MGCRDPDISPSAVNIPWNGFLRQDATVKPPSAIQEMFHAFGMNERQEVITYCLGGLRSAWVYFLLKLAGYERVRNYPGSWWEWSRDFAAPAEKDMKLLYRVTGQTRRRGVLKKPRRHARISEVEENSAMQGENRFPNRFKGGVEWRRIFFSPDW